MATTETETSETETETVSRPTPAERARFFIEESRRQIGYLETIEGALPASSREEFVRNIEMPTVDGINRLMRNKREHGWHPIKAWEYAIKDRYPKWFKVSLAESQHNVFMGDPEFMSDEEKEYLDYLESEFDVPR